MEALVDDDGSNPVVVPANGTFVAIGSREERGANITAGPWDLEIESYLPPGRRSAAEGQTKEDAHPSPANPVWLERTAGPPKC